MLRQCCRSPQLHVAHPEGHGGGGVALRSATDEPRVAARDGVKGRAGGEGKRPRREGEAEGGRRRKVAPRHRACVGRRRQAGAGRANVRRRTTQKREREEAQEPRSLCGRRTGAGMGGEHQKNRQKRQESYLVRARFGGTDALGRMRQFSLRQKRQSGPAAFFSRVLCARVWPGADP